jgi:hypothetical protein
MVGGLSPWRFGRAAAQLPIRHFGNLLNPSLVWFSFAVGQTELDGMFSEPSCQCLLRRLATNCRFVLYGEPRMNSCREFWCVAWMSGIEIVRSAARIRKKETRLHAAPS